MTTKKEVIEELSKRTNFSKKDIKILFDEFTNITKEVLKNRDDLYLAGIGTFSTEVKTRVYKKKDTNTEAEIIYPVFNTENGNVRFREVFGMVNAIN